MKRLTLLIACLLLLTSCTLPFKPNATRSKQLSSVSTSLFLPVIEKNLDAINSENVDAYMSTIHEESPAYSVSKSMIEDLIDTYQLSYKLNSWELTSVTEDEINVRINQTTTKISGPEFKDSTTTAIHTLRRSGNDWKIYSTTIEKVEYLN